MEILILMIFIIGIIIMCSLPSLISTFCLGLGYKNLLRNPSRGIIWFKRALKCSQDHESVTRLGLGLCYLRVEGEDNSAFHEFNNSAGVSAFTDMAYAMGRLKKILYSRKYHQWALYSIDWQDAFK